MSFKVKTKKRVKAILKYQDEKAILVKRITGVNLIPQHLKLKPYNLTSMAIIKVGMDFSGANNLLAYNCVHCVIYNYDCKKCPYSKRSRKCNDKNSLFRKVNKRWKKIDKRYKNKLNKLGEELEEALIFQYKPTTIRSYK